MIWETDAAAVEEAVRAESWRLTDILVTHHHAGHIRGIAELKGRYGCRVVAPRQEAGRIANIDVTVGEGDIVTIGTLRGRVLETPGHTAGHLSYWFNSAKSVLVGDTLFSVGCGRLLETTANVMWESMLKLRNLPADTKLYCGHEYTASNVRFALAIEPQNTAPRARAKEVVNLREAGRPTIPSTLFFEELTNPFLRADLGSVAAAVDLGNAPAAHVLAALHVCRNNWIYPLIER